MIVFFRKGVSKLLYPSLHTKIRTVTTHQGEYFSVRKRLGIGWYMLESKLDTTTSLYFVTDGKEEFELPVRREMLAKRIIRLSQETCFIKIKGEGGERFLHLRFVPLTYEFAKKRMLRRIRSDEAEMKKKSAYHDCTPEDFLFGVYNHLFSTDYDAQYQYWLRYVEPGLVETLSASSDKVIDENRFILFCAPGYRVASEAKQLMSAVLSECPSGKIVYVDEDVIDAFGVRSDPYFKPDWNPDLFYSQDYISSCYMCCSQWYLENKQIFMRYGQRLALSYLLPSMGDEEILHLPVVLAHAEDKSSDDLQPGMREKLLKESVLGVESVNAIEVPGYFRLNYEIPDPAPLVSLLIPTRDGLSVLKPCVESILDHTSYLSYEILILDNQSSDVETLKWLAFIASNPKVRVLSFDKPFNYSAINNFGVRHAKGSVIGLINNDIEVISSGWLREMVSHACRPEIGCVGAKLYYSDGRIQHAGVVLGLGDVAGHVHRFFSRDANGYHGRLKLVQNYSAVTAACLLVRRSIFEEVGGLEEEHLMVAYNDVDFCLRVRAAGYRNLWTPFAELYHHESVSRGKDNTPEKRLRYESEVAYMKQEWCEELHKDPCYNPNLSLRCENFSIRELI